jgi:hypothetical protein
MPVGKIVCSKIIKAHSFKLGFFLANFYFIYYNLAISKRG